MYLKENVMSKYKGKGAEKVFYNLIRTKNTDKIEEELSGSNIQYGYKMAAQFLTFISKTNDEIVDVILKPRINGAIGNRNKSREPKADVVVLTKKGQRYRISLKQSSKDSGVGNFTTHTSFQDFMQGFIARNDPGAVEARDKANELFASNVGLHVMLDKRHYPRFLEEIDKPEHHVPENIKSELISLYKKHENEDQYDELITSTQDGLRTWIRWLAEEQPKFLDSILLEAITGRHNFGDQDATANLVVTPDGAYTPEEYVPIFRTAKFTRGTDIGRINKTPRAAPYNPQKSVFENFTVFCKISAAISF
jgi:hypothetical protein